MLLRLSTCGRLLDAWPNARPPNRDRTLIEYLNATRGVPLERLGRCVQLCIEAGGDFIPPAGEVLRRAAAQAVGGRAIGTDPDAVYWHEKRVNRIVRKYLDRADRIAPLDPDAPIPSGPSAVQISERSGGDPRSRLDRGLLP